MDIDTKYRSLTKSELHIMNILWDMGKATVAEVMENTGIDFSVYTQAGELLAGQDVILDKTNLDIDGVKVDEQNAQTLFALKFKGKKFIGCIKGATNIESNYAFLISKLCENLYFKDTGLNKQEFLKMVLFGEIGQAQIYKYMRKFSIKDQPVYAMLISVEKEFIEDVKNVLSSSADGNDFVATTDDEQVAFAKFVDESLPEYQSPTEYAEFIKQMVYEETGVNIAYMAFGFVHWLEKDGKEVELPFDDEEYYAMLMERVKTSRRKENVTNGIADLSDTYNTGSGKK